MSHRDALLLLFPLPLEGDHGDDLSLEGKSLDTAETRIGRLLLEMFPSTAADHLPSWERVLGLSPAADATRSERTEEALFRLRSLGRLDRQYFIDLAAALGFTITIKELMPLMAGWAEAGQEVLAEEVRWVWEVTTSGGFTRYARAGQAAAGDPLMWFRDNQRLRDVLDDLKPAHTKVIFV